LIVINNLVIVKESYCHRKLFILTATVILEVLEKQVTEFESCWHVFLTTRSYNGNQHACQRNNHSKVH